ncbi:MAG TPA: hypothetical protein DCQ14_00660 [Firmicutes bacterium]|nr:hypothetical protein [Bacillota bacterium]
MKGIYLQLRNPVKVGHNFNVVIFPGFAQRPVEEVPVFHVGGGCINMAAPVPFFAGPFASVVNERRRLWVVDDVIIIMPALHSKGI